MKKHLNPTILNVLRLLLVFAMLFQLGGTALAYTWTDPTDYPPGSTVTIRGDNSDSDNAHNWSAGETVHVDVVGPKGYLLACDGVADDLGAWTCDVTLDPNPAIAVGEYTYTAKGVTSGNVESGMFTDSQEDYKPGPTNLQRTGKTAQSRAAIPSTSRAKWFRITGKAKGLQ